MNVLRLMLGSACGVIVGALGGLLILKPVELFYRITGLYEPGTLSVGWLAIVTLPTGALIGAALGAFVAWRWNHRRLRPSSDRVSN